MAVKLPRVISVTPTVDTAIYASGDQLGSLMTITNGCKSVGVNILESITIIDKAKQKSALSVLFFSASPTMTSVDNGVLDISDSEMASKCVGIVTFAAADYKDLNLNSVATLKGFDFPISSASDSFFSIMLSAGTPTYTSTSDLTLKFGFRY